MIWILCHIPHPYHQSTTEFYSSLWQLWLWLTALSREHCLWWSGSSVWQECSLSFSLSLFLSLSLSLALTHYLSGIVRFTLFTPSPSSCPLWVTSLSKELCELKVIRRGNALWCVMVSEIQMGRIVLLLRGALPVTTKYWKVPQSPIHCHCKQPPSITK